MLTAVVVESVTMIALVVAVPLLLESSWRLRNSTLTSESCRAISASFSASSGLSWCTALMAPWWSSKTPSRYLGRSFSSAARKDSLGTSLTKSWKSVACAKPAEANGRASRRSERKEGIVLASRAASRQLEKRRIESVASKSDAHHREQKLGVVAGLSHGRVSNESRESS
jgi:hypothetical protein